MTVRMGYLMLLLLRLGRVGDRSEYEVFLSFLVFVHYDFFPVFIVTCLELIRHANAVRLLS
jgi:hypothetical protein